MGFLKKIPWLLIAIVGGLVIYFKDDIMEILTKNGLGKVSNFLTKK